MSACANFQAAAVQARSQPKAAAAAAPAPRVAPRAAVPACAPRAAPARASVVASAAAAESKVSGSGRDSPRKGQWTAVVANAEWMLNDVNNESFPEVLRERSRFYSEKGWDRDFFIVANPAWLDEKFPDLGKRVRRPCVAVVSTDEYWVRFLKLRLDRVARVELGDISVEEATKSTEPLPEEWKPLREMPYPRYELGWWKAFEPNA